jgi:hypothetical protein
MSGRFFLQQTVKPNSETLTILGGEKGSPASYGGTVDADGNVLNGSWVYPGGGGYDSIQTRKQ